MKKSVLIVISVILFSRGIVDAQTPIPFEWNDTLEEIRTKIEMNGYNFIVDHNWVFDMTPEEKLQFFMNSTSSSQTPVDDDMGPLANYLGVELPESFDWRNHNGHSYIGPIRDQGRCGSCYAFGACAAAEGAYNIYWGLNDSNCYDFSESFIMWCLGYTETYYDNFNGCAGTFDNLYYELESLLTDGICIEADFPYLPHNPNGCLHWNDPRVYFDEWYRIPCNDVDAIKTAIMEFGVVVTRVFADSAFNSYNSGIYEDSNTNCTDPCYHEQIGDEINHAVALVGWNDNGDAENEGYWILRNSWGDTDWGEKWLHEDKIQISCCCL